MPSSPELAPFRAKFDKIMSEFEDDYVVRDDEMVAAFRNIYDDDDDDDSDEAAPPAAASGSLQNGITFGKSFSNKFFFIMKPPETLTSVRRK